MTRCIVVLANEGGSTTKESICSSGDDNTLCFTLLAGRTSLQKLNSQ